MSRAARQVGWGREIAVAVVVAAGLGALVVGGDLSPLAAGVALGSCLVSPWLRSRLHGVPWPVLTVPVLLALVALGALGHLGLRPAVGLGLAYLVAQRRLGRAGPSDDRVSALLATVMLVAAASATTSPLFLGCALAWAAALPLALAAAQLDGWRVRRSAAPGVWVGLALATLLLGVAVFPVLPRVAGYQPAAGEATALTGFDEDVELGEIAELFTSDVPVFRAWVETAGGASVPGPMYFRGVVLDHFDGTRWTSTAPREGQAEAGGESLGESFGEALARAPAGGYRILVDREPVDEGVLFTMGRVVRLGADFPVERDADGNWFLPGPSRRVEYVVQAMPPLRPGEQPDPAVRPPLHLPVDLARWTALPDDLDPRVRGLAADVAGEAPDTWAAVTALQEHLLESYAYTRGAPDPGDDPLGDFLFERREGHCEYFASALAVLVRSRGIPARLVNGFVGGEYNEVGGYWLFRRHHAHSWVEVHLLGLGWVYVDATPALPAPTPPPPRLVQTAQALETWWYGGVVDYDAAVQTGAVFRAGRQVERWVRRAPGAESPQLASPPWLGVVLLGLLGAAGGVLAVRPLLALGRRLSGERRALVERGPVARHHARARRMLARRGREAPPQLPPVAAARWLCDHWGGALEPMEELAWLHYRVRYGGEDEHALSGRAAELVRELRQEVAEP